MNNLSRYSFVQYIIKLAYSQINNIDGEIYIAM